MTAMTNQADKLTWIYEHLPTRFKGWVVIPELCLFLNISPKKAEQYLRILQVRGQIKSEGWDFVKADKTQKKVTLNDIDGFLKDETDLKDAQKE